MFRNKKYLKEDAQYIFNFIEAHPFATFVFKTSELLATHIPVLIEGTPEKFKLYAHIAQASEQYQYLKDGLDALLIFQGAHAYISSSWYREADISTWDYSAVHVNVKIRLQSQDELRRSLSQLVAHFEKHQENPLYYEQIPKKMIEDHLPLITGFWAEPTKIQAIAKLHQGFEAQDVHSVCQHLEKEKNPLANELSKNIKKEYDTRN